MTRRLYNIAVVTSLVLFVVVMGLWVVSLFYGAAVFWEKPVGSPTRILVTQLQGCIVVSEQWKIVNASHGHHFWRLGIFSMFPPNLGDNVWLGVGYDWDNNAISVAVPHWLLAILAAILPVVWLIRRRRKRDPDTVLCAKCGYDLRGSPNSACPECGAGNALS